MRIARWQFSPAWVLLVVAGAAASLWLVFRLTMAMVFAHGAPQLASRWWPESAEARANIAGAKLTAEATAADVGEARRLAEGALRREPTNVPAARTLGLVAYIQGRRGQAERLFAYSESLSRRDVPTQLWLIEDSVGRNDIAGALTHYDRALRTSTQIRELLFPILVQAAADPSAGPPLARLVGARPNWWRAYAEQLFERSRSSRAILTVLAQLRLRAGNREEMALIGAAVRRLVDLGDYAPAFTVYRSAEPGPAGALLRDGGFEGDGQLPPLDWELRSEPGLSAYPQVLDGVEGRRALFISSESGRGGYVARQLLMLAPGRYRLAALVGEVPAEADARPLAAIVCAGTTATALLRQPFPPPGASRLSADFTVPAYCRAQWLTIEAGTSIDSGGGGTPWIDAVRLSAR